MLVAGLAFLVGAAMTSCAGLLNNHSAKTAGSQLGSAALVTLVLGRVSLGVGVGFANQAVPLFLNEMSPARLRGAFNIMFQLATTVGIILAQLVNVSFWIFGERFFLLLLSFFPSFSSTEKEEKNELTFFFFSNQPLTISGRNVAPRRGRGPGLEDLARARRW